MTEYVHKVLVWGFGVGQACRRLDIFMKTHENSRRKKLKLKSLKAKTQELSP